MNFSKFSVNTSMSGRNRGPPHLIKGAPLPPHHSIHDPPFGRLPHPMPILDDIHRGPSSFPLHHPAALIEEHLAAQHQDIQGLLIDNQRLAATHVALKQELAAAQHELHTMSHAAAATEAEADAHLKELYDRSLKMEAELREAEAMRMELMQVRMDIQKLNATRQELTLQGQALTMDLARVGADLQQVPVIKAEIDSMKQELQRARAAIEHEKKGHAENYEHGQAMEKNLISMAREVEKLRAEIANAEKRARAAAAAGNPGAGYGGNYPNPDTGHVANSYPTGYGMNLVQGGVEGGPQYGTGPATWGSYDMQRAHGRR